MSQNLGGITKESVPADIKHTWMFCPLFVSSWYILLFCFRPKHVEYADGYGTIASADMLRTNWNVFGPLKILLTTDYRHSTNCTESLDNWKL